ncbi:MAG: Rv3235 family protein [Microcella sp.]|uniref:Rv3235 family protein n=1 Tax=Microcella sp. TaxID=1913979 RepID=UPI00271814C2|nr:Rv3235 family protein [Microcella sp.]MDO8338229.1 Rv3235 family protein [Microcella sp.]
MSPAAAPAESPVVEAELDQAATPRARTRSGRTIHARIAHEEFFDYQPTSTADLPDPRPLVENLTRCVIEILAGARELEQIARWVTDDVYSGLLKRQVISARARAARGRPAVRPAFALGSTIICEPRDGIIEAVVVVNSRARSRAVAVRLEGLDRRWRASAIHVL